MDSTQFVIFKIENEDFGVEITNVREIIRPQQILKVPNAPKYIEGIINLRGKVHPIFNLRKKFHMDNKEFDDSTKIIIVNVNDISVGFIVDDVSEILRIEEKNIEDSPNAIVGHHRNYIKCVGKIDDRMIIILDLNLIMSEDDELNLKELVKLKHPANNDSED
jgi:purine-binding chemotaxis protein CheW